MNGAIAGVNLVFFPHNVVFYGLTIVWAFILADNFVWAYVVDPDRDVAERAARRAERENRQESSQERNSDGIDR